METVKRGGGGIAKMKERNVKTFDELYSEVCSEVRGAGKSIDLCEKMKLLHSDLKRVQVLLEYNPGVVTKFTRAIGVQFQGKNLTESSNLLSIAKSLPYSAYGETGKGQNKTKTKIVQGPQKEKENENEAVATKAIEILTQALRLSPWRKNSRVKVSGSDEIHLFKRSAALDDTCIQWLVKKILQAVPVPVPRSANSNKSTSTSTSSSSSSSFGANCHDNGTIKKTDKTKEKNVCDAGSDDLLGKIYFERCVRLCERGDYKLAILDVVRGIICNTGGEEEKEEEEESGQTEGGKHCENNIVQEEVKRKVKLTFRTVAAVGVSLKALGHLEEATLVFQQAAQLLRLDSTMDNEAKSRETINIVKVLKDIKANTHFSPAPGNKQGQPSNRQPTNSTTKTVDSITTNLFQNQTEQESAQVQKREKKQRKLERRQQQQKLHGKEPEPEPKLNPVQIKGEKEEKSTGEEEEEETIIPRVFGEAHPILIAASDALDLKYDNSRGRHAVAKRTIPPGATLIVDTPYSWSLHPHKYKNLCQHCCRQCDYGIPCQFCSSVVFCSFNCWQKSYEEYHKYECQILKGLDSSEALGEMALLCYRTVCKTNSRILRHYANANANAKQVEGENDNEKENHNDNYNDNDHDNTITKLQSSSSTQCTQGSENGQSQTDSSSLANNSEREWKTKTETERNMTLTLGLNSEGKLDPKSFSAVFALTTNSEQRTPGEIIKRTLAAIYLTLCLRFMNHFQQSEEQQEEENVEETSSSSSPPSLSSPRHSKKSDNDNEESVSSSSWSSSSPSPSSSSSSSSSVLSHAELQTAAFMLRLSQSLSCNAYGINSVASHTRDNDTGKLIHIAESEQLGGALYPTISMINHSCNPNVFRLSIGNKCVVRSILEIQKGEELFDSYGPLFTVMGKSHRKPVLKSQYFFDCDCDACKEDWPSFQELKKTQENSIRENLSNPKSKTGYKCPHCNRQMANVNFNFSAATGKNKKGGGGKQQQASSVTCPHCGQKMEGKKMMEVLVESERKYLAAKNSLISTGTFPGGLQQELESAISNHISVLQKFLCSPHKLIVECQETLKLAWNAALLNSSSSSQD